MLLLNNCTFSRYYCCVNVRQSIVSAFLSGTLDIVTGVGGIMSNAALLGKAGEDCVAQWLFAKGYAVITQNSRCRQGEIDVVAVKGDTVACVEVKTRMKTLVPFGVLVPVLKQRRIAKAALSFLQQHHQYQKYTVRFDVAFVSIENGVCVIAEYIPHAFSVNVFTL